ncbi:MAG: hypothetical protein EON93_03620 [Burkholderiales bacterium]|nr:MAG: hypothetical protein EON93_03620 [Burkholderiales bacterium]
MSALAKPNYSEVYEDALANFNEVEDFMGELAEMLTHLADALTTNPDQINLSKDAAPNLKVLSVTDHDWPSFARLRTLHAEWRAARDTLLSVWHLLGETERETASPLPPFGAQNLTNPVV